MGTPVAIYRETRDLVQIGQKKSDTLREHKSTFYCRRRHTFAKNEILRNSIVILLAVRCGSAIHTDRIVAFPLQQ
jgi:DUF2075 family protein